jgi:DNA-binding NarL/FixJ family response regulator
MNIKPIRTIIVDDHPHARLAIRELLTLESSIEVVDEATSGVEAIELALKHQPDLMIIDINMAGMDGLDATRRIKEYYPKTKIIIATVSDDVSHLFEALKKGAQGYLLKHLNPQAWLNSFRAFINDDLQITKDLAMQMLLEFEKVHSYRKNLHNHMSEVLTLREQEVLELVTKGLSNREIGQMLFISEHTVKNHLKNIMYKLQVDNRVKLANYLYK